MAHRICLKYFMTPTKNPWPPSYIINVRSLKVVISYVKKTVTKTFPDFTYPSVTDNKQFITLTITHCFQN